MWVHVKWGVTIIVEIEVAEAKTCSVAPACLTNKSFNLAFIWQMFCYEFEVKRLNLLHLRQLFIEHLENSSTQLTNLMECNVSGAPLCGNTRELTDT